MKLRRLLTMCLCWSVGCAATGSPPSSVPAFSPVERSIAEIGAAMAAGHTSSRRLVREYRERVDGCESTLHATMALAPDAWEDAVALDAERADGNSRGPLHGLPIAVGGDVQTTSMPVTAGMLAFKDYTAPAEAELVQRLRAAGAVVFAATTLTELGGGISPEMPSGYNAARGHAFNPFDQRRDRREGKADGRGLLTAGSGAGSGTSANFWVANVAGDAGLHDAEVAALVAIRPTIGRVSRSGVALRDRDHGTPVVMARSVADAEVLLRAIEGEDVEDSASGRCDPLGVLAVDTSDAGSLRGARIGVPRAYFYDRFLPPGAELAAGGLSEEAAAMMREAIEVLAAHGAVIVEPADLPSVVSQDPERNRLMVEDCLESGVSPDGESCSLVGAYAMKRDLNQWLRSLGEGAPAATLTELRVWNLAHRSEGAMRYGQASLDRADAVLLASDHPRWQAERAKELELARTAGIDAALEEHDLDALLLPSSLVDPILREAGYPGVTVPFATVAVATGDAELGEGDQARVAFGVSFIGTACSESRLIEVAQAFESVTGRRQAPNPCH